MSHIIRPVNRMAQVLTTMQFEIQSPLFMAGNINTHSKQYLPD